MIEWYVALYGMVVHWIGDFILQSNEQAIKKSSSMKYLTDHTLIYSCLWVLAIGPLLIFAAGYTVFGAVVITVLFGTITFFTHTAIDYVTSRAVKHYFSKHNYHNGFVVIGLDQILHYAQLFVTYKLLMS